MEKCARAIPVTVERGLTVTGTRLGAGNAFVGSEAPACRDGFGEEMIYALTFPKSGEVTLALDTGGWAILQLRRDCAFGPELACGNETSGLFSYSPAAFTVQVDAGTYYAILDSEAAGAETYTLKVTPSTTPERQAKCDSAVEIAFDAGRWSVSGDTTGKSALFIGSTAGLCGDGRAAEALYRLSLSEPSRLQGEISTATDWGIFELRQQCLAGPALACANESAGFFFGGKYPGSFDTLMDPGSYFAIIDSEFDAGQYSATVRATPYTKVQGNASCAAAYVITESGRYAGALADAGDGRTLSCGADAGVPDVRFRLELQQKSRVTVDVSGGFTPQRVALSAACSGPDLVCTNDAFDSLELEAGSHWLTLELHDTRDTTTFWLDARIVPAIDLPDGGIADAGFGCSPPCGATSFCVAGACQSCAGANRCGAGCSPCPSSVPYCSSGGDRCVACRVSSDCAVFAPCCTSANVCQANVVGCQ